MHTFRRSIILEKLALEVFPEVFYGIQVRRLGRPL
jgi:hypothetical protein